MTVERRRRRALVIAGVILALLTLDLAGEKPTITKIHLTTKAKVPGIDKAKFAELAHNAEVGCPVSRLLKAAEITLDATLL